jgi:hypothetical protein
VAGAHTGRRWAVAAAAVAGAVLGVLAPPGGAVPAAAGPAPVLARSSASPAAATSTGYQNLTGATWSGYAALGTGFTSVSAGWTAPAVRCGSPSQVLGPWVGLGGVATTSLQQTGLEVSCASGRPAYRAWYESAPEPPVYHADPVRQGDRMTARVDRTATGYTLTVADLTRNWSRTVRTPLLQDDHGSAEVVLESPTRAFPAFGGFTVTDAAVDGKPFGSLSPVALDSGTGDVRQTRTGTLAGGTFTVTYLHE